ncbi:hypothetical protein BC829DRAFT_378250 [Chytridium lagenaria]|nr:hypothetical protein BC829DRAFT_378250 [Chytridium lagenaria]
MPQVVSIPIADALRSFRLQKNTNGAALILKIDSAFSVNVEHDLKNSALEDLCDALPDNGCTSNLLLFEHDDGRVCFLYSLGSLRHEQDSVCFCKDPIFSVAEIPKVYDLNEAEELDAAWLTSQLQVKGKVYFG